MGKNRKPDGLLNADKATEMLAMGVSLKAPLPQLAESHIPPFNATEMAKRAVQLPVLFKKGEVGKAGYQFWTLRFPELVVQDVNLPATLLAKAPTLAQDRSEFKDGWVSVAEEHKELAEDLVSVAMWSLGWDKPAVEVAQHAGKAGGRKPWELVTAFPTRLVTGTGTRGVDPDVKDGLENTYLALPRMAKA
jgi:hypothetical protein